MKLGDLVKVTFGTDSGGRRIETTGIFVKDDLEATGENPEGYPVITRAMILWDGQIYSTPLDQIEPLPPLEIK